MEALGAGADPMAAASAACERAQRSAASLPYDPRSPVDEPECTLVAAIVGPRGCWVAWCGDSRAYALGQHPRQLTRDDSWMAMAIAAGVDPQVAQNDRRAHAITQCLGMRHSDPEFHVERFELEPGQSLLLCTDGLWNDFDAPQAIAALDQAQDAGDACQAMVQAANDAGGHDNITAALWRP